MVNKLLVHKNDIDADLKRMAKEWRDEWATQYTSMTMSTLDSLLGLLNRGGKRIRGALAMESYFLHGGTNKAVALGAARVIELVQAQLLIMDDVQDKALTRRGAPSVHIELAGDNGAHYGVAQALNAELLAVDRATIELMQLEVSDSDKVRAAQQLSKNIDTTVVGQINDLHNQVLRHSVDTDLIRQTLTWKTAYYTFVSPLELGACLAGKDGLEERFYTYALHAGVAFQMSDDILGVFGDSHELGKSANDDIREGKATLLVAYAYEKADTTQRKVLDTILGKEDATDEECGLVRQVLEQTGSHTFVQQAALDARDDAVAALGDSAEEFLIDLVRMATVRTK